MQNQGNDAITSRRAPWLILILAFPLLAALPAQASEAALTLSGQQVQKSEIATAPLARTAGSGRVTLTGRAETAENGPDPVLAPTQARVIAVCAHPGDSVEKGAPLLALAGPEVAALRRALDDAITLSGAARQRAVRERQLYAEGIISKARLEQAVSAAQVADGLLANQRMVMGSATFEPGGRLLLRASRAGMVSGPAFGTGDAVGTGDLIAYIGKPQAPLISLDAPVAVARALRVGDELKIHSRGCEEAAVLHAIGRNVDPATQTVALHAEVAGPSCLLPGEIITATATPRSLAEDAFALPAAAFVRRGSRTFLFVDSAQGFIPVAVDTNAASAGFARATSLRTGMKVVVKGTALLKAEWLKRGDT
jgi:cobalt-zinc-cadmium efflux system membrane fusion protein